MLIEAGKDVLTQTWLYEKKSGRRSNENEAFKRGNTVYLGKH